MSLQSFPIINLTRGFQNDVKPPMLPDNAWALLENSYTFRERELKREGRKFLGRLERNFSNINIGLSPGGTATGNLLNISGYISNITQAVNAVVTTTYPENLQNGDLVIFSDVVGMVEINGLSGTVTVINSTSFSVNIDSTGFTPYASGGFWFSSRSFILTEPNAQLVPGTLVYTLHAGPDIIITDQGNGTMTSVTPGNSGTINYVSGAVTITTTAPALTLVSASFSYYPDLPVMGIPQREIPSLNFEQTVWFDTIYAYAWTGTQFTEFIPGTAWAGTDSDLFWAYNYRGANAQDRLFFVTNDVPNDANPMRYTDGTSWTNFVPQVTSTDSVFQCRIIIAYYGRLLLLNTWEGLTSAGPTGSVNIYNRCRFSQLGTPVDQTNSFRSDIFGRGGFLDAPTDEQITGATFIKNTLVVDFERTTWQLRYVGEYGLPFVWERISADFGSESTFSGVLFDNHRLAVGDKAITAGNGGGVDRIDPEIPNQVFDFKNANNGVERVTGIRDYKKELVFWNFVDSQTSNSIIFPNKVLLYNYRNKSWAIFRDSITAFGTFQSSTNTTWDSLSVFWDDEGTTWDDTDTQSQFPIIVCGDQQGFISCYGYPSPSNMSIVDANDQETLFVQNVTSTGGQVVITSPNHNLITGEIIYITGMMFVNNASPPVPVTTSLNNTIYQVQFIDANNFALFLWDSSTQMYIDDFPYTPDLSVSTYIGGGDITLFPKLNMLSKDINIFQSRSLQTKLSRLDFLIQSVSSGQLTIKLYLNSSSNQSVPGVIGNKNLVWNGNMSIDAKPPFYTPGSDYAWFRFYATLAAQYFNINITYDDDLMNTLATHSQDCTLYAINAWCREGGKNVF